MFLSFKCYQLEPELEQEVTESQRKTIYYYF